MKRTAQTQGDGFYKVAFSSGREHTGSIILTGSELDRMTLADVSRRFPVSEAAKMKQFYRSPRFETFEDAFNFDLFK